MKKCRKIEKMAENGEKTSKKCTKIENKNNQQKQILK